MGVVLVEILIVIALFIANGVFRFAALLGVAIAPPADDASATLAAFVGDQIAGHPREGDCYTRADFRFEIIDMDRTSVDKILIERALEPLPTETSATAE